MVGQKRLEHQELQANKDSNQQGADSRGYRQQMRIQI